MYPFDFATCTAMDIIKHSVALHPTLFKECLEDTARMHKKYSVLTTNEQASKIAASMAQDCRDIIEVMDDLDDLELSRKVIAFNIAAKLQCVPRSLWADIIAR